jgi:recombination protein RecT
MTTALATAPNRPADMILNGKRDAIMAALPGMVAKDRFIQIAAAICNTKEIAGCDPASVMTCVFGCAKLGLIPDPVLGHVYLIPYGNTAKLIPGYKGYIELARRSGRVGDVHTDLVHECDEWEYWKDENGAHIRHVPNLDGDRSNDSVKYVYCITENRGGRPSVEVMTRAQIEKNSTNSPVWKKHWDEMARKTVVRRASKTWPLSPELAQAVHWDEQAERGEPQAIPVLDEKPQSFNRLSLADPKPEGTEADAQTTDVVTGGQPNWNLDD